MTTKEIKARVKHAYEMKAATHETKVVFNVYSDSIYILDTEEDNIIEMCETEEDAIGCCAGIKEDGGGNCYYKPILVDADSGKRVTRKNFDRYDLNSERVKTLLKDKSLTKDDHDRETEHQLRKLRMSFFVAELAILSKKYGIAIQSTGGVHFADFDAIEYDNDPSSGDLHYFYTLK